jgi:hypothetical protein
MYIVIPGIVAKFILSIVEGDNMKERVHRLLNAAEYNVLVFD